MDLQGFFINLSSANKGHLPSWEVILDDRDHTDIVEVLLGLGADPNQKLLSGAEKYLGFTMLEYIASRFYSQDSVKTAEVLIRHGADVNERNPLEMALMCCVDVELVKLFLKNGASIYPECTQHRCSPAVYLFDNKDESIRKETLLLLMEYGLDVHFRNELGQNLLHIYSQQHDILEKKVYLQ